MVVFDSYVIQNGFYLIGQCFSFFGSHGATFWGMYRPEVHAKILRSQKRN